MASSTVTVYRNGDPNYPGKKLVVNRRQIRSFDAFLDKVTRDVKMKTATRAICTPTGGHRIKELDKIQSGGIYVAVGPEKFRNLGYKDIREPKAVPRKFEEITPVRHSKLVMSGRARKVADAEPTTHKTIFVFRNGDDLYPSRKMLLTKRELSSMDKMLAFVTEKVRLQSGAVYCIFTMQGREVKEPSQIENNAQYVAVGHGKKFKKVAYSDHGASHNITPRRAATKPRIVPSKKTSPNRTKAKSTLTSQRKGASTTEQQIKQESPPAAEPKNDIESFRGVEEVKPQESPTFTQRAETPPERELEEEVEENVQEPKRTADEDQAEELIQEDVEEPERAASQSHEEQEEELIQEDVEEPERAASQSHEEQERASRKASPEQPVEEAAVVPEEENDLGDNGIPLDDSLENVDPSVYQASGEQKVDAGEINEDKDTVEDKPIDQLPAEEVEEEQIDGENSVQQSEKRDSEQNEQ